MFDVIKITFALLNVRYMISRNGLLCISCSMKSTNRALISILIKFTHLIQIGNISLAVTFSTVLICAQRMHSKSFQLCFMFPYEVFSIIKTYFLLLKIVDLGNERIKNVSQLICNAWTLSTDNDCRHTLIHNELNKFTIKGQQKCW